MKRDADEVLSEFSAARIPFEQFAASPEWRSLPFSIQLAVLHIRRAEQQPMPETHIEEPDDPACLTPALLPARGESHLVELALLGTNPGAGGWQART